MSAYENKILLVSSLSSRFEELFGKPTFLKYVNMILHDSSTCRSVKDWDEKVVDKIYFLAIIFVYHWMNTGDPSCPLVPTATCPTQSSPRCRTWTGTGRSSWAWWVQGHSLQSLFMKTSHPGTESRMWPWTTSGSCPDGWGRGWGIYIGQTFRCLVMITIFI